MLDPNFGIWTDECELCSLVGDGGCMCGGLKPLPVVCASQIRQGASLLEPSTQRHLDVTVDVPGKDMTINILIKHMSIHSKEVSWGPIQTTNSAKRDQLNT